MKKTETEQLDALDDKIRKADGAVIRWERKLRAAGNRLEKHRKQKRSLERRYAALMEQFNATKTSRRRKMDLT